LGRFLGLRARHEWLDHLSRAGERYVQQRGNHLAAAVTFFSVLTAVPLLVVAFGAAGYVLWLNPTLLDDLRDAITTAVPGALSDAVLPFVDEAVSQRNAVAGLGLLAAVWSGIWWTSNLREAVSAQWALPAVKPTSVARFWHDLRVFVVLGVTLLGSISISVLATGALDVGLARLGLGDGGVGALVPTVLAAVLGLGTGFLVFWWILTRLPRTTVPRRGTVRAAVVGGAGFRGAQAGDGPVRRQRERQPRRRGVRLPARPAAVLLPRVAVRPAGVGVGGDGARERAPGPAVRAHAPRTAAVPGPAARTPTPARPASRGALAAALGVGVVLGIWVRGSPQGPWQQRR
jgi:membrane protein